MRAIPLPGKPHDHLQGSGAHIPGRRGAPTWLPTTPSSAASSSPGGIDKYIFICLNRRFERSIKLSYSKTEVVQSVDQVQHKIFREALRLAGVENQVELSSIADVPANCGLGSSSSFTVALLTALRSYTRDFASLRRSGRRGLSHRDRHTGRAYRQAGPVHGRLRRK